MPRRGSLVLTPRGRRAQRRALHGSDVESSQAESASERDEDSREDQETTTTATTTMKLICHWWRGRRRILVPTLKGIKVKIQEAGNP